MKILSIDFDYFIDADISTRDEKFPVAEEITSQEEIQRVWDECYEHYPEIKDIGVISDYDLISKYLKEHPNTRRVVKDSHKFMYDLAFSSRPCDLEVVNIDFHHDRYIGGRASQVDCSNWVRFIEEEHPELKMKWVKRSDSETSSLLGEFPYETTEDLASVLNEDYDVIFLCFSPEWTPPHLRDLYNSLV